jgi:hypothetical protein
MVTPSRFVLLAACLALLAAPEVARPEELPAPVKALLGSWEKVDAKEPNLVRFEEGRMAQFRGGQLLFSRVCYQDGRIVRLGFAGQKEPLEHFEVKDQVLTLIDAKGGKHTFRKLDKDPPQLLIPPLPFGERKALPPVEVRAIQTDLARREKANIQVRQEARELRGDAEKWLAKYKEMEAIDAADTKYLAERVKEIGWIDSVRFGSSAEHSAYLIVMHTKDLSLMQAALPELEKEVKANRFDPELFAGLYDRFRTITAQPERYGMHITPTPDGELVVGPLEDRRKVDHYRKEIGLPPLAEYLKRYQAENGGKEVRVLE